MLAIKTENLTKIFPTASREIKAVDSLNLEVPENVIFGFLGPNAAGKTTTLKLFMGLLCPNSGKVSIMGKDVEDIEMKKKVGFLPENPTFYNYLTGWEFLDYMGRLFGLSIPERKKRIEECLTMVGLVSASDLYLKNYSRGMLQRIGIAQAIINDPEIVFLDEPVTGLDPVGRKEVRDIIRRIKEKGKTVFFCSHVLQEVELMCNWIGILCKGKLLEVGKLEDLLKTLEVKISASRVNSEGIETLKKEGRKISLDGEKIMIKLENDEESAHIVDILETYGGKHISVFPQRESLEEHFINQIEKEENK